MRALLLEKELQKHNAKFAYGCQDTIISIRISGLEGDMLAKTLQLADQLVEEKVKACMAKTAKDKAASFDDPSFGPKESDPDGVFAICNANSATPSQFQENVKLLFQESKIRWERPQYASDTEIESDQSDEEDDRFSFLNSKPFSIKGKLFIDGGSSGDIIQGNLGNCWFLSALSVVATRNDLLQQIFWRGDAFKGKGVFVCRFMKSFTWHYVIIDDKIPVFGFSKTREGKPYFARCRDPNELWVPLAEKAYAKFHGCYGALIGGFADVALNDLTGMCSEQIVLQEGHPGYIKNMSGGLYDLNEAIWAKIVRYRNWGSLMGCSIQPLPQIGTTCPAETLAAYGLYYKHAYALVDAGEFHTINNDKVRLIKLRNPWGLGEWTGPWSDSSDERQQNHELIEKIFGTLKRTVGGNAYKRIFLQVNHNGEINVDEVAQEEVVEIDQNDGTFFMSFEAWLQYFSHFFAGIDFPDGWHGRRLEGYWNEENSGGHHKQSLWTNNPRISLHIKEQCDIFISLSQEDPRGKQGFKLLPICFHVCSHQDMINRRGPPAVIPGTIGLAANKDGTPQPTYAYRQNLSVETTIEAGKYCIIPSIFTRTDQESGKVKVGRFWISVYASVASFNLENGEIIAEEEEGVTNEHKKVKRNFLSRDSRLRELYAQEDPSQELSRLSLHSPQNPQEKLILLARAKNIGLHELKAKFGMHKNIEWADARKKLLHLGIDLKDLGDDGMDLLKSLVTTTKGQSISCEKLLNIFRDEEAESQLNDESYFTESAEPVKSIYREGVLSVELRSAKNLICAGAVDKVRRRDFTFKSGMKFSKQERAIRREIAQRILATDPHLRHALMPILDTTGWYQSQSADEVYASTINYRQKKQRTSKSDPFAYFYGRLNTEYQDKVEDTTHLERESGSASEKILELKLTSCNFPEQKSDRSANSASSFSLHTSDRLRDLEEKRTKRFQLLKMKSHAAIASLSKTTKLPGLLSSELRTKGTFCVDCRSTLPMDATRQKILCSATNCANTICLKCIRKLPKDDRLCQECYEEAGSDRELFGSQLRAMLITKTAMYEGRESKIKAMFNTFDNDKSEDISYEELSLGLTRSYIQPPLSEAQTRFLFAQFDANNNGKISLQEFVDWIDRDQLWEPQQTEIPENYNEKYNLHDIVRRVALIVDDLLEDAYSIIEPDTGIQYASREDEVVVYRRVVSLGFNADEDIPVDEGNIAHEFLKSLSIDENGDMDLVHSEYVLSRLGRTFSQADAYLLGHSFRYATQADVPRETATFLQHPQNPRFSENVLPIVADKMGFVNKKLTEKVLDICKKILHSHDQNWRAKVCDNLRSLQHYRHVNMIASLSNRIQSYTDIYIEQDEMQELIRLLDAAYVIPSNTIACTISTLDNEESARIAEIQFQGGGDVLAYLIRDYPSQLVRSLELVIDCDIHAQLYSYLQKTFRLFSVTSLWKKIFESGTEHAIDRRQFIKSIIKCGFLVQIGLESNAQENLFLRTLISKISLSFMVSMMRKESEITVDNGRGVIEKDSISFSFFVYIIEYNRIQHIQKRFWHILRYHARKKRQIQLVTVSKICGSSSGECYVRATDPILRHNMELLIPLSECSDDFLHAIMHTSWGNGRLITHETHPTLDRCMQDLLKRLCLIPWNRSEAKFSCFASPYRLILLDSSRILEALRDLLRPIQMPFFWSLSSQSLHFYIDNIIFTQMDANSGSFRQVVAGFISTSPNAKQLLLFIKSSRHSLMVKYHIIGSVESTTMSTWEDFQNDLVGRATFFATIELLPEGSLQRADVGRSGNIGEAIWNFKTTFEVKQPEKVSQRIDMPILFTDILRVSVVPDCNNINEVIFMLPIDDAEGHFMIVNVRKGVPLNNTNANQIYCTAYDPQTAIDYSVTGHPENWSEDFFQNDENFKEKWHEFVPKLRLHATITHQIVVRIYTMIEKVECIVGERRISIGSAIANEGQILENWYALFDPDGEKCKVLFEMAIRFDLQKDVVRSGVSPHTILRETRNTYSQRTNEASHKNDSLWTKIEQLGVDLSMAEAMKAEALSEVSLLPTQIQSSLGLDEQQSTNNTNWKRKYKKNRDELRNVERDYEIKIQNLREQVVSFKEAMHSKKETLTMDDDNERTFEMQQKFDRCICAADILSSISSVLQTRCKDRPFNALKKAMATITEAPGKISLRVFYEVLEDFGFRINDTQQEVLDACLDPESIGQVNLEDFFSRLSGNESLPQSIDRSELQSYMSLNEQNVSRPVALEISSSTRKLKFRTKSSESNKPSSSPSRPRMLYDCGWKEVKQMLILNLPQGWDMRLTDKGKPYFCNHANRATQWYHPIPEVDRKFKEWFAENTAKLSRLKD